MMRRSITTSSGVVSLFKCTHVYKFAYNVYLHILNGKRVLYILSHSFIKSLNHIFEEGMGSKLRFVPLNKWHQCVSLTVAGRKADCLKFDVATKHVTVHYALVRFLSGLHLHLGKYELDYFKEGLLPPVSSLSLPASTLKPNNSYVDIPPVQSLAWWQNSTFFVLLNHRSTRHD